VQRLELVVEDDLEIANDRQIVFLGDLVGYTVEQYREAYSRWGRELFRICPSPLVCVFRFGLEIVES
jgi:hypothetical protein